MAFREEHCLPAAERGPVECSLYEPALFMNRAIPAEVSTRLEAELAEGRIAAALITAMRGAQMGPAALRALPRPLLEFLAEMAMNGEDKQTGSNYVPMRALAATLRFDSQLAVEMSGKLEDFRRRARNTSGRLSTPYSRYCREREASTFADSVMRLRGTRTAARSQNRWRGNCGVSLLRHVSQRAAWPVPRSSSPGKEAAWTKGGHIGN
jgi:hypothetical protein